MPKALKRFTTQQIETILETGDVPEGFQELLEDAVKAAKEASDWEAPVQFFITHDEDEVVLEDEDDVT